MLCSSTCNIIRIWSNLSGGKTCFKPSCCRSGRRKQTASKLSGLEPQIHLIHGGLHKMCNMLILLAALSVDNCGTPPLRWFSQIWFCQSCQLHFLRITLRSVMLAHQRDPSHHEVTNSHIVVVILFQQTFPQQKLLVDQHFFHASCERLVISLSVKLSCMPWSLWDGNLENGWREDEASGGLTMKQPDIAWSRESVGARVCSNCAVHSMTLRLPFPHTLGLKGCPATVTLQMLLLVFRLTVFARSLVSLMPLRFPSMNPSSSSWSHELVFENGGRIHQLNHLLAWWVKTMYHSYPNLQVEQLETNEYRLNPRQLKAN